MYIYIVDFSIHTIYTGIFYNLPKNAPFFLSNPDTGVNIKKEKKIFLRTYAYCMHYELYSFQAFFFLNMHSRNLAFIQSIWRSLRRSKTDFSKPPQNSAFNHGGKEFYLQSIISLKTFFVVSLISDSALPPQLILVSNQYFFPNDR